MRSEDREIVSTIILSADKKILLGKVREGGVYPDCWHIPGGGVEQGETKFDALQREIKEEVGIDIQNEKITLLSNTDTGEAVKIDKYTGEKFLAQMHFNTFQVELQQTANDIPIELQDDLTEYRWVEISKLKKYKHTPPSQKLFKKLGWL